MTQLNKLFEKYDRLVLFDTETTGLLYNRDEIIEFAAVVVELRDGVPTVIQEYDELITLSPGGFVPRRSKSSPAFPTRTSGKRASPRPVFAGTSPK
jgi:DNA polymerase III epsilon subunit-like protein